MSDFMQASHVFLDNPATTVEEALTFLSEKAVELGIADDAASVLDAYHKREEEGSTGMVNGFSIPHAKSTAINKAAVIVVKYAGEIEDWETMDEEKISCAISLLVPGAEAGTTHLKLLSKVAVMLMQEDFRETVKASSDAEEIAALINANLEDDEDEL
ncbi:MAG: fructose PTS transporter subunit IIA [Atopobiaceae bacterium]|nr:fructose PTS transporter subunit IIA [Atopobiaceae bacterium]